MKHEQLPASHRPIATWQHLVQPTVDAPIRLRVRGPVTPAWLVVFVLQLSHTSTACSQAVGTKYVMRSSVRSFLLYDPIFRCTRASIRHLP